jgi:hypothetical protein
MSFRPSPTANPNPNSREQHLNAVLASGAAYHAARPAPVPVARSVARPDHEQLNRDNPRGADTEGGGGGMAFKFLSKAGKMAMKGKGLKKVFKKFGKSGRKGFGKAGKKYKKYKKASKRLKKAKKAKKAKGDAEQNSDDRAKKQAEEEDLRQKRNLARERAKNSYNRAEKRVQRGNDSEDSNSSDSDSDGEDMEDANSDSDSSTDEDEDEDEEKNGGSIFARAQQWLGKKK